MNSLQSFRPDVSTSLSTFIDECDILFQEFFDDRHRFTPLHSYASPRLAYPINISQNEIGVEFELAVIGKDKSDIEISIDDGILRMSYRKKEQPETKDRRYIYRGITEKSFDFSFKLDPKLDTSKISASMDKGLLKVSIPFSVDKMKKVVAIS